MSVFGARILAPAANVAKPGFAPERTSDPEYNPDYEPNQLRLKQAKSEPLNASNKPIHQVDLQVISYEPQNMAEGDQMKFSERQAAPRRTIIPAIRSNGRSDIGKVRSNLHRQLKMELNDAQSLETIDALSEEEQSIAFGLEKKDLDQIEKDFGSDEAQMRNIIKVLIKARQLKASEESLVGVEG
ncbi:hypothetical protein E2P81_ATG07794 [Venturia nashicola]|uniref:Uncharacterized protein n=1 Tax=Venturia nashicola TaxID=86259 RepID=A0A4Z1NJ88_9PEZI|nr:hypothetical protein E6O75_ATG07963 [Venturia nashicola]TLD22601.1 hypothetical protein E2P81_ATG07794 [Venturia nashicola]